ncbi:MAG: CHAT domain-containing tetratricopeptide repeat protein [Bacteroidota bacterium]
MNFLLGSLRCFPFLFATLCFVYAPVFSQPDAPAESLYASGIAHREAFAWEAALKDLRAAGEVFAQSDDVAGILKTAIARGEVYYELKRSQEGLADLEAILDQALTRQPQAVSTGRLMLRIGILHWDDYNDEEAMRWYRNAEPILERSLANDHLEFALLNHFYGEVYNSLGDRNAAIEYFQKAIDLYQLQPTDQRRRIARVYMILAQCYIFSHQSEQALLYGKQSVVLYEEVFGQIHPEVATAYRALGHIYTILEDNAPALKYHKKSLEIVTQYHGDDHHLVARGYNSMGNVYENLRDSVRAEAYYYQAEEIARGTGEKEYELLGAIYHNLGIHYFNFKNYARAREYWQRAIPLYERAYSAMHYAITEKILWIGETHHREGRYDEALEWYHKVMGRIDPNWEDKGVYDLPPLDAPRDRDILFAAIGEKAGTMLARYRYRGQDQRDLEFAARSYSASMDMLDSLRQGTVGDASRMDWNDFAIRFTEGGISTAAELHAVTGETKWWFKAFSYMERSRSSVLMSAINSVRAAKWAGVPDSLLQQENDLRQSLGELDMEIYEMQHNGEEVDQTGLMDRKAESFAMNLAYQSVVKEIEERFPQYYELKYDLSVVDPAQVQAYLPDAETALVEYFLGDSALYIFAITQEDYRLVQLPSDTLEREIERFMEHFGPEAIFRRSVRNTYPVQAHRLYERLLAPLAGFIPASGKLILIPDGRLARIPFEALLTRPPKGDEVGDFARFPYLLHPYSISYANSATLLLSRQVRRSRRGGMKTLAFAPAFGTESSGNDLAYRELRAGLSELEHAPQEVQKISRFVQTDVYTGAEATETLFKTDGANYNILHFATHGMVEDQNSLYSRIAFSPPVDSLDDGMLHTYELFSMKLNADLAVLSACNTGTGELVRGEGIMSLARGFMYAGCPSIVMSLWSVNDEASSRIMGEFYRHLARGEEKDESLRAAKLSYLKTTDGRDAHPYFWAAHVMIGDRSRMGGQGPGPRWLLVLVALGGGAFAVGRIRSRQRNAERVSPNRQDR